MTLAEKSGVERARDRCLRDFALFTGPISRHPKSAYVSQGCYPQSTKGPGRAEVSSSPLDQPVLPDINPQALRKLTQIASCELGWHVKLGSALAGLLRKC
jgi:hypothetical protein